MEAYQRGDVAAFEELVARHERHLWCFVRRFVGDPNTAEDVAQETFLRVVASAPEWRAQAKFTTWLYTIARNLCTDHARRAVHRQALSLDGSGRRGRDDSPAPVLMDRIAAPGISAEGRTLDSERAARIEAAVAALPPEQREVFLMREVSQMPFAEIAEAVGVSEPTVKSRMRYALEKLRVALAELYDGPPEEAAAAGATAKAAGDDDVRTG